MRNGRAGDCTNLATVSIGNGIKISPRFGFVHATRNMRDLTPLATVFYLPLPRLGNRYRSRDRYRNRYRYRNRSWTFVQ